jgi:hypothetical protein
MKKTQTILRPRAIDDYWLFMYDAFENEQGGWDRELFTDDKECSFLCIAIRRAYVNKSPGNTVSPGFLTAATIELWI